jgi:hypothetical protein
MAFDGFGNLYIVTSSGSNWGLYKLTAPLPVAKTTAVNATQFVAPTSTTPTNNSFEGIAFNGAGQIYMSTADDRLYLLKTATSLSYVGTFTVSGVGNDLTACAFPASTLPVTWESFSGTETNNGTIELNWVLSQQVNNKGFYIQQSTDGVNWVEAGYVPGAGTDPNQASYSFTDFYPANALNYFRILQDDLDGKENYSEIITVNIAGSKQVSAWPNPATDVIHINSPLTNGGGSSRLLIYDISGRIVMQGGLQSGMNTVQVASLPHGTYILTVKSPTGESYNQKLIVQSH